MAIKVSNYAGNLFSSLSESAHLSSRGGPQEDTDRLDCDAHVQPLLLSDTQTTTVRYTYRVTWDVSVISML